ncbi:zinc finger protein 699-like isoform X1 [Drosophila albomicans]|uniref:Zinc finger protein 699-like isoform X1 n=2 Tax=Drosophila albomicans TaxID=7291 RepID=A0A6P8XNW0_DROAB|nr:zinc finger protein 699-like isoform X1 [Drosophila albomicans]
MKETCTNRGAHRKRLLRFDKNDKIRLIAAVRLRRLLWDVRDSEHKDLTCVKEAWQSVGAEMGREANECKVAWRSLRQSYRYHCKAANSRFNVDCDSDDDVDKGDVDPLETPDIHWEFATHMVFLQEMSGKRSDSALDETPPTDSIVEDYTDMEYLENYDIAEGDNEDNEQEEYPAEDELEEDIYYLTSSSKEMQQQPKIVMDEVLCRTCVQPIEDAQTSQNLFDPHNNTILQDIKELTDLLLTQDDDHSDFICSLCQQHLEMSIEFRRSCIDAQSQIVINVHMKEESDEMDYPESLSITQDRASEAHLKTDEVRLEDIDISDSEEYYEEVDVQPLPLPTAPPTNPKKLKKDDNTLKLQCHECGLTFTSQDLLKMHMHQTHNMQLHTRFVCKHCGHDFKYSAPLVEHLKSIGVHFGYKCEECGQKFHSRHFLKKHKRRIHGVADEHICHICGKNFTTGFNLRNHIVRHAGTRPHKCKLCSAAFSTTAELNNHKRTHDNVRPYPCRYACGKSFRHCSNRSTHERVHMDGSQRPFQCEYCDKSFVTKGDCRAHQMVHTMSRDYNCEICEQSFKLQKHYQHHLTTKSHKKLEALRIVPKKQDSIG